MAQVMYDRAIMFDGVVYSVTQTWNGPDIVLTVTPENEHFRQLLVNEIMNRGQLTLHWRGAYYEFVQSS